MPSAVQKRSAVPKTYAELHRSVEAVVVAGRRRIDDAWVRTYHETGRLIAEHLLLHGNRADYGAKVYERLSEDTRISRRTLHECVQFYDRYLADVHILRPSGDEIFLNNALLENRHAVPMGAEEMTDWTP